MRYLFAVTNGRFNRYGFFPHSAAPPPQFGITSKQQKEFCKELDENSFYCFEKKLEPAICEAIQNFSQQVPILNEPTLDANLVAHARSFEPFDRSNPGATKYLVEEQVAMQAPEIQRLLADDSVRGLAGAYLGTSPVLSSLCFGG